MAVVPVNQIPVPNVTRIHDGRYLLSGLAVPSGWTPRDEHIIQRADNGSSIWVNIGATPPVFDTFLDTTTRTDSFYRWRVVARSGNDRVGGEGSPPAFTCTLPVADVQASRLGTDIRVDWRKTGTYHAGSRVDVSVDGGPWAVLSTVLDPNSATYVHKNPDPLKSHRYRVVALRPGGLSMDSLPLLKSEPVESSTLLLVSKPDAPILLRPLPNTTVPSSQHFLQEWQHRSADGSQQTAYQLGYRTAPYDNPDQWSDWVDDPKSFSNRSSKSIGVGISSYFLQHRIRTWGAHPDPGPWSATHTLRVSSPPSITILYPDGPEHQSSSIPVKVAVHDPDGDPVEMLTIVLREKLTGVTYSAEQLVDTGEATFSGLNDGWDYTVEVQARAGGLLAVESADFHATFPPPAKPTVNVTFNRQKGTAELQVQNPGQAGRPAAVKNEVYVDGKLAAEIPAWGTWVDPIPDLRGTTYHVVAVSELPSTARSDDVELVTGDPRGFGVHFNTGVDFSRHVWMSAGGPEVSNKFDADVVLTRWDGDRNPTATFGPATRRDGTISGMVFFSEPDADEARWVDLARRRDLVVIRTVDMWVATAVTDVSISKNGPEWGKVSVQFTEVET